MLKLINYTHKTYLQKFQTNFSIDPKQNFVPDDKTPIIKLYGNLFTSIS